jgi:hypothetical protein
MRRLDRRTLLRGAGGVALGLPLLDAMIGKDREAYGQSATIPKRFIVLYQTQGTLMDSWLPTQNGSDYTFGPILDQLTPHKQDMVVLTGIDDQSALLDHVNAHERAPAHVLIGRQMLGATHLTANGPSLDHVLADRISPADIPIQSLHLGANRPWEFSFTGPQAPIDRLTQPMDAFNLLFTGFVPPGNGPDPNQAEALRQQKRKLTVLDSVKTNAASLRQKLGAQDKMTLDAYLDRINAIETRITATNAPPPGAMCMPVMPMLQKSPYRTNNTPPTFNPFYDPDVSSRAMMDLIVEALACDRTRVVTMGWDEPNVYDWLTDANGQVIQADDWHQDYVHPGGGTVAMPSPQRDRLFRVFRYYHGEANYFLDKMKSTTEGDGTLLDHSLVLSINEFSSGSTHSSLGKPYWIAGKLGGMIQTGRWLQFNSVPHNRLLLSVLRAFGQTDATFGDPQFCGDGPLTGLV